MLRPLCLLATLVAACSSPEPRPPGFDLPGRDAGPEDDRDAAPLPEDPGPGLPEPDLLFVLPWHGPEQTADLEFTVGVRSLDVHFSVDTTGSFRGEIDELQDSLLDVVLPGIRGRVADATFGVSRFEDFPVFPFGNVDDRPFRLLQAQTTNDARASSGVDALEPLGNGLDEPESSPEALYQIATGEGLELSDAEIVPPFEEHGAAGTLGGAGFRVGALPVIVQVTDAPPHEEREYFSPIEAHTTSDVERALSTLGARVVGIASGEPARPWLEHVARETGAVTEATGGRCDTGVDGTSRDADADGTCPLVFDIESGGAGLSATIVDAVQALLDAIVFEIVTVEIVDDELGFVTSAVPLEAEPPPGQPAPEMTDEDDDGELDSFRSVRSGTRLVFRLVLANDVVRPSDYDQIFFLTARIVADGETILDEQRIEVIVPAGSPAAADAGPADAAPDA